jgi:hypothetical protein
MPLHVALIAADQYDEVRVDANRMLITIREHALKSTAKARSDYTQQLSPEARGEPRAALDVRLFIQLDGISTACSVPLNISCARNLRQYCMPRAAVPRSSTLAPAPPSSACKVAEAAARPAPAANRLTAIPLVPFTIAQMLQCHFRRKHLEDMRTRHNALLKLCEKIQAAPAAPTSAEPAQPTKARTDCHSRGGRSLSYP